jgi:hypothetical protein
MIGSSIVSSRHTSSTADTTLVMAPDAGHFVQHDAADLVNGSVRAWLDLLGVLAQAQADAGLVPREAADSIVEAVDGWLPDPVEVGALTRATGHSTLGLIRVLERRLPEHAREWVYYGATVQDLSDTWSALVMRQMTVGALSLSSALPHASKVPSALDARPTGWGSATTLLTLPSAATRTIFPSREPT